MAESKIHNNAWVKWIEITDGGEHNLPLAFSELLIMLEVGNSGSVSGRNSINIPYDFLTNSYLGFDVGMWYRSATSNSSATVMVSKTQFRRGSTTIDGGSADNLKITIYYR